MAEVLLQEGLVREEDWCGNLADSIKAGLNQWVNDALGAASLNVLRLEFVFSDDLEHAEIYHYHQPDDWIHEAKGIDGKPVAIFALRVTQYEQIFTGKAVLDLEEIEPGAGFSLFHILCSGLYATVDAATPAWAWEEMDRQDEWEEENEVTDPPHALPGEEDYLNKAAFEKGIPRETYRWDLTARQCCNRLSTACARIAGYTDPKHKAICKALEAGIELSSLLDAFAKWRKQDELNTGSQQQYFEETRQLLPIGVRWCGTDNIDRITDEYHDLLMQSGEETDLVWLYGYQTNAPRSIKRAIAALQHVLKILPLCDQLLQSLAGPAKFATAKKKRHRKVPLAQILATEAPDSGPVPDLTNL